MKGIYTSALFACLLFANQLFAQLAGDYDYSFGNYGMVETDINQSNDKEKAMLIQPDGKIIVAGLWSPTTFLDEQIGLARYNLNGTPDSAFGTYGIRMVTHAEIGAYGAITLNDMKLQSDGKILLTGGLINYTDFSWNFFLVRFNADGAFDSTFSHDGIDTTTFGGFGDIANSLAIQPNGKIVVAGAVGTNPFNAVMIRYNADASVDSTFGTNGVVIAGTGTGLYTAVQPDGKILLSSDGTAHQNIIQRYDSLGVIDPTFTSPPSPFFGDTLGSYLYTMQLQSDGKILLGGGVGGSFVSDFALVRLNTNGSPDSTFGIDGLVVTSLPGSQYAYSTATQTDGKIVATGYSTDSASGKQIYTVLRYLTDGTPDSSFHFDGVRQDMAGGMFQNIELQNDGKIVAAGYNEYNDNLGNVHWNYVVARFLSEADSTCTNSVTQQPADVTLHADSAARFALSATNPYAAFQWQVNNGSGWQNINNGGKFSGANNNLLQMDSVTSSNNQYRFRCIITYGISCADTSVSATLSVIISDISPLPVSSPGFAIFPNPSVGFINIMANASIINLRVTNIAGQLVYESRPNKSTTGLSIFDSGIYFITVTIIDGESSTRRLVVCK